MKIIYHRNYKANTPPRHDRLNSPKPFTLVLDLLPSAAEIDAAAKGLIQGQATTLEILAGYSVVHEADQFDRRTGLEYAMNDVEGKISARTGKPMVKRLLRVMMSIDAVVYTAQGLYVQASVNGQAFRYAYSKKGNPIVSERDAEGVVQALMLSRRTR